MKTYTQHRCNRHHRTYATWAHCTWPRAAWITGDGPYALLARCDTLTVMLFKEETSAQERMSGLQCGHACTGNHEIVRIAR